MNELDIKVSMGVSNETDKADILLLQSNKEGKNKLNIDPLCMI